jgi:hypothetical protein
MSIENKFVPMSEANTERIRTTATLPFQLHEQVGLNVRRIHTICQVAGFRSIRIQNDQRGETSQSFPQIVGIDRNGSAVAGKVALKEVPTYQSDFPHGDSLSEADKQSRWKNLNISLNTEEMKQRILLSGRRVTDSLEWGKQLDSVLKRAMVKNGALHLVKDITRSEQKNALLLYTAFASFRLLSHAIYNYGPQEFLFYSTLHFVITGTSITTMSSAVSGVERSGQGRRVSLFYGPELDRALILLAIAYTSRLAKGVPKDEHKNLPL